MSGFSSAMFSGLLQANTAMTAAQAQQRSVSHLQSRAQTLQTEIRSGIGDVQGRQAELEQVQAQTQKASAMIQNSLNNASQSIGAGAVTDTEKADKTTELINKTDDKKKNEAVASDKAKDEAKTASKDLKNTDVVAVDYEKGMHIGDGDKTAIAVSPEFLETMAEDKAVEAAYQMDFKAMDAISQKYADTGNAKRTVWTVDKNGAIRHHAVISSAEEAATYEATRLQIEADGRAAFGLAFAGASVEVESAKAAQTVLQQNTGLLIDTSL